MLHSIGLYFTSTGKMTAPTGPRFSRQPRGKRPLRVIWSRPATLEPRGKQGETPQLWSRLSQNGYRPKQILCTCKLSRTPCLRLGDIIQSPGRGTPPVLVQTSRGGGTLLGNARCPETIGGPKPHIRKTSGPDLSMETCFVQFAVGLPFFDLKSARRLLALGLFACGLWGPADNNLGETQGRCLRGAGETNAETTKWLGTEGWDG